MIKSTKLSIALASSFLAFFSSLLLILPASVAHAAPACGTADQCDQAAVSCQTSGGKWDSTAGKCNSSGGSSSTSGSSLTGDLSGGDGKIDAFLQDAVDLLTVLAGLAIAASVIFAGIRYSSSGGNPQAAAEAKKRITNAVIATVCWVLLYTFLNWLIPGKAFN